MTPQSATCATKQELIEELQRNHSALVLLGSHEFEAVVNGDWTRDQDLAEQRKILQDHREYIVRRIREHVSEHGC
jgi:hypothetical protein